MDRGGAGPGRRGGEPVWDGGEGAAQWSRRPPAGAREHDVGHALALEMGWWLGGSGLDDDPAPVAIEVQGNSRPAGVKPDERLDIWREEGLRRKGAEPRQQLAKVGRNRRSIAPPPAAREPLGLVAAEPEKDGHTQHRDGSAQRRSPQGCGAGRPGEGEPGEDGPQEPVRGKRPDGEDREVPGEGEACARAAAEYPQAVRAHSQRRGTEQIVEP